MDTLLPDLDWSGPRITALRERLGMNRTDFAYHIGVSRVMLWQYEAGRAKPRDAHVVDALKRAEAGAE